METDLPRWVIQTAEKWGLYWGGYGWNNGCTTPRPNATIGLRDPPHFEFRGTVEHAAAIADFNLRNDPASICFDVVDDGGDDVEACNRTGRPEAGWRLPVDSRCTRGRRRRSMINLTATGPPGRGSSRSRTAAAGGRRTTSALTFAAGDTTAAMAVVPIDADGRFCVYRSTDVHSIVDVPRPHRSPTVNRCGSTRRSRTAHRHPRERRCEPLPGVPDGPVPDAGDRTRCRRTTNALGSPTWPSSTEPDRVSSRPGPATASGTEHLFSNLNYHDDAARSNLALRRQRWHRELRVRPHRGPRDRRRTRRPRSRARVRVGTGSPVVRSTPASAADAGATTARAPARVIELDLATEAPGAAIAVTVTEHRSAAASSRSARARCSRASTTCRPRTSTIVAGQTVTNLALVDLDDGDICVYTLASAHVIVDVQAELAAERDAGLEPTAADTRPRQPRRLIAVSRLRSLPTRGFSATYSASRRSASEPNRISATSRSPGRRGCHRRARPGRSSTAAA